MAPEASLLTLEQAVRGAQTLGLERLDAQLLLLHALAAQNTRAWLMAHGCDALDPDAASRYQQLSQRRAAGEPLAYLLGSREFFGLDLAVDPRVLIPRADTETLVTWALEVQPLLPDSQAARVLDMGTGSGAIALAIKHNQPRFEVYAIDASAQALNVAAANAKRLGLLVDFQCSSWFDEVQGSFDLIVSNPPYVAEADPHLPDLRHEPMSALIAGADGLAALRRIIDGAPLHLRPGGWLLLEHGYDQAEAVQQLLRARGFSHVSNREDLAGVPRCSGGVWLAKATEPSAASRSEYGR